MKCFEKQANMSPEYKALRMANTGHAKREGLGDKIERLVHPIAVAINWPCLDDEKKGLRPESRCAKMRDLLNKPLQSITNKPK